MAFVMAGLLQISEGPCDRSGAGRGTHSSYAREDMTYTRHDLSRGACGRSLTLAVEGEMSGLLSRTEMEPTTALAVEADAAEGVESVVHPSGVPGSRRRAAPT